jgi:SAM-dependent methyltransferase
LGFNNPRAVEIYTEKTELFPIEEKLFIEYLSNPQKVLDLGCGTGRTTAYLNLMGHTVTGIDIAKLMIEKARNIHPDIDYRVMDATNLDFDDHSFDSTLFSFNGLDYIHPLENRLQALNEIHRVLRNGGVFIYSSHDSDAVRLTWRTLTRLRHYKNSYMREKTVYGNLITYYGTRETNIAQLRQAGFTDIRHYPLEGRTWRYYTCRRY